VFFRVSSQRVNVPLAWRTRSSSSRRGTRKQLRFVLTEGKKRQIRRMCEQVGLFVTGLKRVRIGRVNLGHLPVGQWRYLMPHEGF
jgi:pseudouridine synthase